jgi:hypothetical protein
VEEVEEVEEEEEEEGRIVRLAEKKRPLTSRPIARLV